LTCEPTIMWIVYHGSSSFFPRLIASQTMSRFLLVVLALFAVSDSYLSLLIYSLITCSHLMPIFLLSTIHSQVADVQVAFARLKTDVSSSSATSSSPQQIRKAYHSRPHLESPLFSCFVVFSLGDSIWLPLHITYTNISTISLLSSYNLTSRLKVLYGRMMQRIFKLWPTSARLVNYTKRDYDND